MKLFTHRALIWSTALAVSCCLTGFDPPAADTSRTISSIVMEQRSSAPDNVVVLCHGKTGYPLREDYRPLVTEGKHRKARSTN